MEKYLFANQYFPADSLFVLRGKTQNQPAAIGIVVANNAYAHPRQVDALMPCFRLGAFGTEGLNCKRINGLFSVLMPEGSDVSPLALDLLGYAVHKLGAHQCRDHRCPGGVGRAAPDAVLQAVFYPAGQLPDL